LGYDHIDIFDHVVMGHPLAGRPAGPYNPAMPILEPLVTLAALAAVTSRVTLGTEVLVLPQREPTLVAKQIGTLDTLSGGRRATEAIRGHAEEAGRDPAAIGLQSMVAPPPRDAEGKLFYAEPERVVTRAAELQRMGFQSISLNATAIFQAGARSVDAMADGLGALHTRLRKEIG